MLDGHVSDPFWAGLADGEVRVQRCRDCESTYFPPAPVCPDCHGDRVEWRRVDPAGRVYSFTRQHRTPPGFEAPLVLGTIELDAGVRLLVRFDTAFEELDIGTRVELRPIDYDGGFDRGRLADRPFFAAVPRED